MIPDCHENPGNASVDSFGTDIFWRDDNEDIDYCRRRPMLPNVTIGHCTKESFNYDPDLQKDVFELCDPDENAQVIYGEFGMSSTVVTVFNLRPIIWFIFNSDTK